MAYGGPGPGRGSWDGNVFRSVNAASFQPQGGWVRGRPMRPPPNFRDYHTHFHDHYYQDMWNHHRGGSQMAYSQNRQNGYRGPRYQDMHEFWQDDMGLLEPPHQSRSVPEDLDQSQNTQTTTENEEGNTSPTRQSIGRKKSNTNKNTRISGGDEGLEDGSQDASTEVIITGDDPEVDPSADLHNNEGGTNNSQLSGSHASLSSPSSRENVTRSKESEKNRYAYTIYTNASHASAVVYTTPEEGAENAVGSSSQTSLQRSASSESLHASRQNIRRTVSDTANPGRDALSSAERKCSNSKKKSKSGKAAGRRKWCVGGIYQKVATYNIEDQCTKCKLSALELKWKDTELQKLYSNWKSELDITDVLYSNVRAKIHDVNGLIKAFSESQRRAHTISEQCVNLVDEENLMGAVGACTCQGQCKGHVNITGTEEVIESDDDNTHVEDDGEFRMESDSVIQNTDPLDKHVKASERFILSLLKDTKHTADASQSTADDNILESSDDLEELFNVITHSTLNSSDELPTLDIDQTKSAWMTAVSFIVAQGWLLFIWAAVFTVNIGVYASKWLRNKTEEKEKDVDGKEELIDALSDVTVEMKTASDDVDASAWRTQILSSPSCSSASSSASSDSSEYLTGVEKDESDSPAKFDDCPANLEHSQQLFQF